MNGSRKRWRFTISLVIALSLLVLSPGASYSASTLDVVVSEIAWMGTTDSSDNEWIELYNNTGAPIDLAGWSLTAADGTPSINLSGTIPAGGYFLLERTDDNSVPGVAADQTHTGALGNDGEQLFLRDNLAVLVDEVDCASGWYSGHNQARVPMVRVDTHVAGSLLSNWTYSPRCGTATNSHGDVHQCTPVVADVNGTLDYTVYSNDLATTATGTTLDHTEMEDALLAMIDGATTSIDIALYGLDRQSVVNALIAAHNAGVTVRAVGDDDAATGEYSSSY